MSAHTVTPNPAGYFDVQSGNSGVIYRVTTDRKCGCSGFFFRGPAFRCSHILAVEKFAAEVLAVQGSGPGSHHPASDVARSEDAPGRCPALPVELL